MNHKLISVVIILILIVGGFFLLKNKTTAPTEVEIAERTPTVSTTVATSTSTTTVKEINIEAGSYYFLPKVMTVNKGDTVTITINNVGGVHDLKIDEFNVSTRKLNSGETESITFVADKVGSFEYYCSIGSHRQMGMVGTLTVQ